MMESTVARSDTSARSLLALAALALPLSLLLTAGIGLAMMTWEGCRHLTPSWGAVGVSLALLALGALLAGLIGNVLKAKHSLKLIQLASMPLEDDWRSESVRRLSKCLSVPCPTLRVIPVASPLALGVLARQPAIVVSSWVVDALSRPEWDVVVAHELAHMRRGDRLMRWLGSWLRGATQGRAGAHARWERLDGAVEDAADQAAIELVGDKEALRSARAKFQGFQGIGETPAELATALAPRPPRERLAIAGLGLVTILPLLPFVVVPMCLSLCKG